MRSAANDRCRRPRADMRSTMHGCPRTHAQHPSAVDLLPSRQHLDQRFDAPGTRLGSSRRLNPPEDGVAVRAVESSEKTPRFGPGVKSLGTTTVYVYRFPSLGMFGILQRARGTGRCQAPAATKNSAP